MEENNASNKILNALYLHVPFCRHLCNYCDFYKRIPQSDKDYENYEKMLVESFEKAKSLFNDQGYSWQSLETLYLGGGTPSLWGKRGADFLESFLATSQISLSKDTEFTLEVNPGSWDDEGLEAWQRIGANRFSLGIQSLDSYFLKTLDRIHSLEDVHDTLKKFQKMNVNFSVDFMLGLPFSKEANRDILNELKGILEYDPSHISLYILTTKDNYTHKRHLPSEEWIEQEYLEVSKFLTGRGYEHYEVSNFAKPKKESRHNLLYWKSESVAALGPSATGFLSEDKIRFKWKSSGEEFSIESLSDEEFQLEKVYMALRTSKGLSLKTLSESQKLAQLMDNWRSLGYLKESNHSIILSPKGYLMLDSLMNDLFNQKIV